MKHSILLCIFILTGCSNTSYKIAAQEAVVEEPKILQETKQDMEEQPKEIKEIEINIPEEDCLVFDGFSEVSEYRWEIVNDGVMGGKSRGLLSYENESMIFSGTIVTLGGGFSSLRGGLSSGVLSDYNSVKLRAKSDGRGYKVTFRDSNNSRISHQALIPFQTPGEFEEVTILFIALEPSYFGRIVNVPAFDKSKAQQIGVILSDGVDGEFQLGIDEVSFCR